MKKKITRYRSKVVKANVTVIGEPNIDIWAKKIKQILDDLEAGRYENEEENKNKPTDN
jgi:hypothetical protein